MYRYRAYILSIYDGDSIRVNIDLGFGVILHNRPIRLSGIDAPELRGEEREFGLVSRDALRKLVPIGSAITIETEKDSTGKYGRYLATIYVATEDGLLNVNQHLIDEGFAKPYGS